MAKFVDEHALSKVGNADLYDNARIFDFKNHVKVNPYFTPSALVDPVTRTIPQVFDGPALKVTEQDLDNRKEGELLLDDSVFLLNAGDVATPGFDTLGHAYLYCMVTNAAWATNPTALTVVLETSIDAFDTTAFIFIGLDGVQIVQTLQFADDIQQSFFMPTMSNLGAAAVTSIPLPVPVPTGGDVTARLVFMPVGAAITNEPSTVRVIGITPR